MSLKIKVTIYSHHRVPLPPCFQLHTPVCSFQQGAKSAPRHRPLRPDFLRNALLWLLLVLMMPCATGCKNHRETNHSGQSHLFDGHKYTKEGKYFVVDYPTANKSFRKNKVDGIILHHTGTVDIKTSLKIMTRHRGSNRVSCHVLIDKDGTRYIMAKPEAVTWHAGYSEHNGRENCNNFMIGIEFQGNTNAEPLTDEQIESAIAYCLPIMKRYGIKEDDITTHRKVRDNWMLSHKKSTNIPRKVDINEKEYERFLKELHNTNKHSSDGRNIKAV